LPDLPRQRLQIQINFPFTGTVFGFLSPPQQEGLSFFKAPAIYGAMLQFYHSILFLFLNVQLLSSF
jgi:hypothetical protein